jgi:hypothetical protein
MATFYLWSNYQNGGETTTVRTPNGGDRNVVLSRNVLPAGEKVTQAKLEADDAEWEALIEAGVVREYPFPDMPAGSLDSPLVHLQKQINQAAESEEERLMAQVTGATVNEEAMVAAAAEAAPPPAEKDKK